ncbi:MAG: FtsQ-type protein [Rhodoglobus sp.]|nr:FtsQ-type protein [Rhodoglobus sp.]
MKRPEGFDPPGRQQPDPPGRKPVQPRQAKTPTAAAQRSRPTSPPRPEATRQQPASPTRRAPSRAVAPDAAAKADLRRSARERRRFERAEVRRFTRRTRNRRASIAIVAGVVVSLAGLVFVAVYSPILALRTITVDGTSRVDAAAVRAAVGGQLGTPLALLDFGRITKELSAFPLIRSYVTETLPPDTLVIHVVERQPVGQVLVGGAYKLVDPAGITVQDSVERVPGVPVIDVGSSDPTSPAFTSVVAVLIALPPALLAQVDSISAHTRDDVSLVLTGVGQSVRWGSADNSARKAALLAALIAVTDPSRAGEFDVSAPSNGIFRPS